MKSIFWKIALLSLTIGGISLAACSDDDNESPTTPDKPDTNKGSVEFAAPTMVMSLEESQLLSNLLSEGSAPASQIKFEVSDEQVARIENSRLISTGAGEVELKATYNGKEARLSVWVEDFRQPCTILPEKWEKYIWNYTASSDKILNLTSRPIVVDFGAEWCSGCKMLDPIITRLSKSYNGRVLFLKVDLTEGDAPGHQILRAMSKTSHSELKPLEKAELPSVVMIPTSSAREPKLHLSASMADNVISGFLNEEFNAQ